MTRKPNIEAVLGVVTIGLCAAKIVISRIERNKRKQRESTQIANWEEFGKHMRDLNDALDKQLMNDKFWGIIYANDMY